MGGFGRVDVGTGRLGSLEGTGIGAAFVLFVLDDDTATE